MADVEREVLTRYSVEDRATNALLGLSQSFSGLGSVLQRATSSFTPLNAAIAAVGGFVTADKISQLGSQFEQTQNKIGGFLNALGFAGDMDAGLQMADVVMERIRVTAAALPGEAEEYISVFQAGLPVVAKAVKGTTEDMINFTNRYTAIAKTLGVDVGQTSRDLALLLREGKGGAALDNKTWTSILPFMKQVEGQAALTQEKFNALSETARADLLQKTFEKLDPMLQRAASSFDAMMGALKSNSTEIVRLGSAPLFEGMKRGLAEVNALMYDSQGNITELGARAVRAGEVFSAGIVEAVEEAWFLSGRLLQRVDEIGRGGLYDQLAGGFNDVMNTLAAAQERAGKEVGGGGVAGLALGAAGALAGGGPLGPMAILGAGLGDFLGRTEVVADVLGRLAAVVPVVLSPLDEMAGLVATAGGIFADLLEGALPGLLGGLTALAEPVFALAGAFFEVTSVVLSALRPTLFYLWQTVGNLFESIGSFLNPVVRILGSGLLILYQAASNYLVPAIDYAAKTFGALIETVSAFMRYLGRVLGGVADRLEQQAGVGKGVAGAAERPDNWFQEFMQKFEPLAKAGKGGMAAAPKQPAGQERGGGGRVVQDFRFSRFELTQKFAEGFDPDRIAVAFARDVGAMGEQKLQSGLEPLFALR